VLSMTCYSAPFDNPTEDSIGERFLREKDKGAVAVFAASWRNMPSPAFSKSVIENLLEPGATIGEAIVHAKKASQDRILVEMYNLLGDPALVLERPRDALALALDDDRWNRGVLVDLKQASFDGEVVVDWLGTNGAKLGSSTWHARDPRFRLALPQFANGPVMQVRVYAAAPGSGRDAVGGLDFGDAPPARAWTSIVATWWKRLTQPAPRRPERRPDTIAILDFETPTH